jgi:hypothetical protein
MSSEKLVEFTKLKRRMYEAAASALVTTNLRYVQTFRRRLRETRGDLERVIDETRPLLTEDFKGWPDLLTAILDTELVLDEVKQSLTFLALDVATTQEEDGARVTYHMHHWTFQMDALLERLDKLAAAVFRHLVRPRDSDWRIKERAVRDDIKKMKVRVAKLRDPLAHGLGGGVTGIQEEHLWEPFLAAEVFDVDLVASRHQSCGQHRQRWHSYLEQTTTLVVAALEATSKRLGEHVT